MAALGRQRQVDLSEFELRIAKAGNPGQGRGVSWTSILLAAIRIENEAIHYLSLHEV